MTFEPSLDDSLRAIAQRNPEIEAFLPETLGDARPTAEAGRGGSLRGVPVGVKDLFRVDGLPTRAGSELPAELFAGEESGIVRALRDLGALVLGKTAMDEFAYCEPAATKNPRDLRRTPGGSSAGSAAAVAAEMCPLAIGSQTLQSTIVPASYCGVVGFKPTFERIPFDGVPLAPSFDTVGFFAPSVAVIRRVAAHVIPAWQPQRPVRPPVLGVPDRWGRRRHVEGWDVFDGQVHHLRAHGFDIRRARLPWSEDQPGWAAAIGDLLHAEMAREHASWYAEHDDRYRPRTRAAIERGRQVTPARIDECLAARETLIESLADLTTSLGIDVWICPSTGGVAPLGYETTGDSWLTSFWSYAGMPAISLPVFDGIEGLPRGFQCVAPPGHDERLLDWAELIESTLN